MKGNKIDERQAQLNLADMREAAVVFTVVTVILIVGAILIDRLRDDVATCETGTAYNETANDCYNTTGADKYEPTNMGHNISEQGENSLDTLADNVDLIALMIALGVVLFIVLRFLGGQKG